MLVTVVGGSFIDTVNEHHYNGLYLVLVFFPRHLVHVIGEFVSLPVMLLSASCIILYNSAAYHTLGRDHLVEQSTASDREMDQSTKAQVLYAVRHNSPIAPCCFICLFLRHCETV